MAFSYGFYNSLNGDRKYNAEQFSVLISCLITDGVLDNWGDMLMARPGTGGLSIVLGSGRAWFNDTWNENDADIPFDLDPADPLLPRIDTLVLEVDRTVDKRVNRVFISKGVPATNAVPTTLLNGSDVFQHALAYITVEPNIQEITADKIQILVGTEPCPFITGILEQASIEQLFAGWEYQFDTWFEELQTKLSGDVAANLQHQIELLQTEKVNVSDKAEIEDISLGSPNKWVDAKTLSDAVPGMKIGDIVLSYRDLSTFGFEKMNGQNINIDLINPPSKSFLSNLSSPERFGVWDSYSAVTGTAHTIRVLENKLLFIYDTSIYMYDLSNDTYKLISSITGSGSNRFQGPGAKIFIETSGDYFYVIYPTSDNMYGVYEVEVSGDTRSIGSIGLETGTVSDLPTIMCKRSNRDIVFLVQNTVFTSAGTGTLSIATISDRRLSIYSERLSDSYVFTMSPLNWDSCNGGTKNLIERNEKVVIFYGTNVNVGLKVPRLNWAYSIDDGKTWGFNYVDLNTTFTDKSFRLAYAMPLSDDEVFLGFVYGSSNSSGFVYYKIKWDYTNNRVVEINDVFTGNSSYDHLWQINSSPFNVMYDYTSGLMVKVGDKIYLENVSTGYSSRFIDITSGIVSQPITTDAPGYTGSSRYICVYQTIDENVLVVMDNIPKTSAHVKEYGGEIINTNSIGSGSSIRIMLYYIFPDGSSPKIYSYFTGDNQHSPQHSVQNAVTEDKNFIYVLHFGKLYKIDKNVRRVEKLDNGWIKAS